MPEPQKGPRGPKKGLPRVGGRAAGTPNKATIAQKITISDAAKVHTEFALSVLVSVATNSPNDSARVSAASALLDRAYGKPAQAIVGGGPDDPAIRLIATIERRIVYPRD